MDGMCTGRRHTTTAYHHQRTTTTTTTAPPLHRAELNHRAVHCRRRAGRRCCGVCGAGGAVVWWWRWCCGGVLGSEFLKIDDCLTLWPSKWPSAREVLKFHVCPLPFLTTILNFIFITSPPVLGQGPPGGPWPRTGG